jgi:hypothetical protein
MSRRTTAILTIGLFGISLVSGCSYAVGLLPKNIADAVWWGTQGIAIVLWLIQYPGDDDGDDGEFIPIV